MKKTIIRPAILCALTGIFTSASFGQNIFPSTGNVGIGTSAPAAVLDVAQYVNSGKLATVLARQNEGNSTGDGTFLGVRGWATQPSQFNGESFSLEHYFYGELNNSINFYRGISKTGGYITFSTNDGTEKLRIDPSGNVGIGTTNPQSALAVNGTVTAKEINVSTAASAWPDYVFKPDYKMPSLNALSEQINRQGHLPDMPSAAEIEKKGLRLGEMNKKLLQKVEELTLYLIEEDKKVKVLEQRLNDIQNNNSVSEKIN